MLTAGFPVKLWDAATGAELRTFSGHSDWVNSVAFSPDGARMITGSDDRTAKLWDTATGAELRSFSGHSDRVNSVAFSPDGTRVLTGSADWTAKLWDAATGAELRTFSGHSDTVSSVAFSPDGARVLTGSWDDSAKLWDAGMGAELRNFSGHSDGVTSVAFSPDGTRVLTGSYDYTARLWDAATGVELLPFFGDDFDVVTSVAFSPDGTRVLTGFGGNTAKLWDAATGAELRTFSGHSDAVESVAFSPDGTRVLTGSFDYTAKLWDAAMGAELRTFSGHSGHCCSVYSEAFSPDGTRVLTGCVDSSVKLWDAATGAELRTFSGHSGSISSVAFSPDGTRVLTGGDETAKLWGAATGTELRTFSGHSGWVNSVAFAPDGARVLTGSADNSAKLWDAETGAELRTFRGHGNEVYSVAFSPDGTRVLTGSSDGTAKLWDTATGAEIRTFSGHSSYVFAVAFSPDGTRVLTGSADSTAKLWDAATGAELRTFSGHIDIVVSVAFSQDGVHVLTGSADSTAKLWDAATGAELRTFSGHDEWVNSVAFSPDGARVLTGDFSMGRFWPANADSCFSECVGQEVDADGDGLSDCVEICNNTDPHNRDTDGDGMPDAWEVEHDLDPGLNDALEDADGDYRSNFQEFLNGWDLNDAGSPGIDTVFVSTDGSDAIDFGAEDRPWRTIGYAMQAVFSYATEAHPVTLHVASGTYPEKVHLAPHVALVGASPETTFIQYFALEDEDEDHVVIHGAAGSAIKNCTVSLPPGTLSATLVILLRIEDEAVEISNVVLDGGGRAGTFGALVTGTGSSGSTLRDSVFKNLQTGVQTIASGVNITRNLFENISGIAVFIDRPAELELKDEIVTTPQVGAFQLAENTGFNRFRTISGLFVQNNDPSQAVAEINDWGVYTEEAIAAGIQGSGGVVDFEPFLGKSILASSLVAGIFDEESGDSIAADRSPAARIGDQMGDYDEQSGLHIFALLSETDYEVTASANGYVSKTEDVSIVSGAIQYVAMKLTASGEGELPTTEEAADQLETGFAAADTDDNGNISLAEAQLFVAGLSVLQFNQLDANTDGQVTLVELQNFGGGGEGEGEGEGGFQCPLFENKMDPAELINDWIVLGLSMGVLVVMRRRLQ